MEIYYFKKSDEVPQWIEKTENVSLTFHVDCNVIKDKDIVKIYPLTNSKEVLTARKIDDDKNGSIIGAPTIIYSFEETVKKFPGWINIQFDITPLINLSLDTKDEKWFYQLINKEIIK